MGSLGVGVLSQFVLGWFTLLVTGRIFDRISSETQATWKEDALAALVICAIANGLFIAAFFVPGFSPRYAVWVYFGLIYYAFQLDGIWDAFSFYCIYMVISGTIFTLLRLANIGFPFMQYLY